MSCYSSIGKLIHFSKDTLYSALKFQYGEEALALGIACLFEERAYEFGVVSLLLYKNNTLKLLHANKWFVDFESPSIAMTSSAGTSAKKWPVTWLFFSEHQLTSHEHLPGRGRLMIGQKQSGTCQLVAEVPEMTSLLWVDFQNWRIY